jgi:hypothetical protein
MHLWGLHPIGRAKLPLNIERSRRPLGQRNSSYQPTVPGVLIFYLRRANDAAGPPQMPNFLRCLDSATETRRPIRLMREHSPVLGLQGL